MRPHGNAVFATLVPRPPPHGSASLVVLFEIDYTEGMSDEFRARITHDPAVMGGRPCVRGLRVTVGTIVGLLASGHGPDHVLSLYPYLERDDITAALSYAAWRAEEVDVPLRAS
jgi:uncharacterized protein (DUF433 family)